MTPKFTIDARMGTSASPGVEDIRTDLLLLTKPAGTTLGPGPQVLDNRLGGLLSRKVKQHRFGGRLGQRIHLDLKPEIHDNPQRHVLLVGLGSSEQFDCKAACKVFAQLIDKALELGVEHVTIPFPANRMTGSSLNLKGTAHLLREIVERKLAELDGEPKLKEIVIFCTPQAKQHVQKGLRAPVRHASQSCCCQHED